MTRQQLIVSRPVVLLLWVGLLNSAIWLAVSVPAVAQSAASAAATARAVDRIDDRVTVLTDRLSAETTDTRVLLARFGEQIGGLTVRLDTLYAVQQASDAADAAWQSKVTWLIVGFFVTTTGALLATLWSIRQGWLRTSDGGER